MGLNELTEFDTSVERVSEIPGGKGWRVLTKTAVQDHVDGKEVLKLTWKEEVWDNKKFN